MSEAKTKIKSVRISEKLNARAQRLAERAEISEADVLRMSFAAGIAVVEKLFTKKAA